MTTITEIAPDLFRLSIHVPELDLQFNHFVVRDQQPLLFHAGLKGMFPQLLDAVATLIDPAALRYVAWSHFEADEVGGLNQWLELAPLAEPVCTLVGKVVSVDDMALRPARGMTPADVLSTGTYRFRFLSTPHLPHGWDAGLLFEETRRTLFCSDLFHHFGDPPPLVSHDLIGPALAAMEQMQQGPLDGYLPYTPQTNCLLDDLAALQPQTLALMHGSSHAGDSGPMLTELAGAIHQVFGEATFSP
jgi:flavorubredoxin